MLTFGKSRSGTSCRNRLVDHFGVTECGECTCFVVVAIRAISTFCTGCGAGGSLCGSPVTETVSLRGDRLLCDENLTANRAMLTFGKSRFGASCGNRLVDHFGVTECGECTGFVVVAVSTITAFCTCGGTGGCGCDYPTAKTVSLCGGVISYVTVSAYTANVRSVSPFSTTRLSYCRTVGM